MDDILQREWPRGLSNYTPTASLATGRISTVVRARQKTTDREVAIKLLHDHLAGEDPIRQRLRREFQAIRRLDHPAVVRADDLVDDGDTLALILEYVPGDSIRRRIERDGPLDWREAQPILDDVLSGLDHAHSAGIWHRNLSADHILIDPDGGAKILGFGLARVEELAGLTMHTRILGALEAMAPERILGMDYDGRADLYSVGAIAHEMLLGYPPGDGTLQSAFSHTERAKSPDLRELPDELPDRARYLLERSLVGDVSARFATTDQMRRALDGVYDEELWQRWASRGTKSCPGCDRPVIDGLDECLYCNHSFRRLVENPGAGNQMIRIITPDEASGPDVWFEVEVEPEPEPECLTTAHIEDLKDLLETYQDTRRVAEWFPKYRFPPYILISDLDESDASRISTMLDDRSIPHRVESTSEKNKDGLFVRGSRALGTGLAWTLKLVFIPFLALIAIEKRRHVFTVIVALIGVLLLITAVALLQVPRAMFVGWALALVTAVAVRFTSPILQDRNRTTRETPTIDGLPVMIPGESLQEITIPESRVELPRRTGRVVKNIDDPSIRRELHELIGLAVAVGSRADSVDDGEWSAVVDQLLTTGSELDRLVADTGDDVAAERYRELEEIEARREGTDDDDERTRLARRRTECLEALDHHDEAITEIALHRSGLQRVRGRLLDMLLSSTSDDDATRLHTDTTDEVLTVLETKVEAVEEVEAL